MALKQVSTVSTASSRSSRPDKGLLDKWATDSGKSFRSHRELPDGSIKAEAVKGGRLVVDADLQRLRKGMWLELAKSDDGKGLLRLKSPGRDELLLTVPLALVKRVGHPRLFIDAQTNSMYAPCAADWLCGMFRGKGNIFEVEGTVDDCRLHGAFVVRDPEAWMHAVEHPAWVGS